MNWRERIQTDPGTLHGKPHVRGTDIPVSVVVDELVVCEDIRAIVACHPVLSEDDVRACLAWAAECVHAVEAQADARAGSGAAAVGETRAKAPADALPRPEDEKTVPDMQGPNVGDDADLERRHIVPSAPVKGMGFKEFLRSMPNVGDDADFERPLDYGRPEIEWDS